MAAQVSYCFAGRARLKPLAALLLALCISACGKYGSLEPPPEANAPPKPANTNPASMNALAKPSIPPITPPKQPFFLDFLLK